MINWKPHPKESKVFSFLKSVGSAIAIGVALGLFWSVVVPK